MSVTWLQVRLINIGSKHTTAEVSLPARRRHTHGVKGRSVRSVTLFETDANLVTELIPSWHGARDENTASQAASMPPMAVAVVGGTAAPVPLGHGGGRDLQQLRQVLREVGGRKVQQEALVKQRAGPPGAASHQKARPQPAQCLNACNGVRDIHVEQWCRYKT